MTVATRILLARHGETAWNADGRWQGIIPTELNAVGHQQAAALATYLADTPLVAIYASDLPRAFQTAEAVAAVHHTTVTADDRLREMHLGRFQGLTREQIIAQFPTEWAAWHTPEQFFDYVVPDGESRRLLVERAWAALNDYAAAHPEGNVLAVTHGGVVRILLEKHFPHDYTPDLRIGNTALAVLEHDNGIWRVEQMPNTSHLRGPAALPSEEAK